MNHSPETPQFDNPQKAPKFPFDEYAKFDGETQRNAFAVQWLLEHVQDDPGAEHATESPESKQA